MFIILKTYFWFLYKNDFRISSAGKHLGIILIKHFYPCKNDNIPHSIDKIKVILVCRITWIYAYSPFNIYTPSPHTKNI